MDDIVKQAMLKWPNVPNCYGWLGLDARGNWYMRDENSQKCGDFTSGNPGAKGSRLQHEKLIDFIGRNYAADDAGQWYFQNGPQRVYVELASAPWIWRISKELEIETHNGLKADFNSAYTDENGWLYLKTSLGFGLVHTQDVPYAAQAVESGLWVLSDVTQASLEERFKFIRRPK
jgi:hypothetical protein